MHSAVSQVAAGLVEAALSLQQTRKQGPPPPRPLLESLPSTMLEGGFQDSELEMRPQEGRERSQYLPRGRRRGSGTIPSVKSLGAAGSWTVLAQRQGQGPGSHLSQTPKGVIDTPEAIGPRISHKHPLTVVHGTGGTRVCEVDLGQSRQVFPQSSGKSGPPGLCVHDQPFSGEDPCADPIYGLRSCVPRGWVCTSLSTIAVA